MAGFDEAIETQLSGQTVRLSALVEFHFRSGTVRLWPGFGDLVAGGTTWQGIGQLGALSPVSSGPGQAVEEMEFNLSGGAGLLDKFVDDAEESSGREVNVLLQFFGEDWQTLGDPWNWFWGIMGPLRAERAEAGEDATNPQITRVISVTASNAFVNRARPPYSFFSDRDQRARHPGDNIFLHISKMAHHTVRWPVF